MINEDKDTEFFCPALWKQRRMFILDVLTRFKIETVLDYGCGEAAVLSYLIPPNEHAITRMAGIDLDEKVLEEAIDRCTPWHTDFDQLRDHPLVIDIYNGSIGVPDDRFMGFQGIICSEVIEHVYPDVLDSFLGTTLGIYQPEIMIVTTPNAEYNINFLGLKYGTKESEFRHDDHKFEWTRKEFETWCNEAANKYGYDVEHHGIGLLNGKLDDLENGHCTSACIFIRRAPKPAKVDKKYGNPHKLLNHIEFPYYNEPPPPKEKIMKELLYYIETLCASETYAEADSNKLVPRIENEEEEDEVQITIDHKIDWNTFNLEETIPNVNNNKSPIQLESITPPTHTLAPLNLPIASLWNVLRLRQICQTRENMIELLASLDQDDYELGTTKDTLMVKKSFPLDVSGDDHSAATFSSRESR